MNQRPQELHLGVQNLLVPKVLLLREEHSRRVLVPKVDFVSAPSVSKIEVHGRSGPSALVTRRCVFGFQPQRRPIPASAGAGRRRARRTASSGRSGGSARPLVAAG